MRRRSFVAGAAALAVTAFSRATVDESAELNALLAGRRKVRLRRDYRVDHPVTVPAGVTLDLAGYTIQQNTDGRGLDYSYAKTPESGLRGRCVVILEPTARVLNGTLAGTNTTSVRDPALEAQHGILCLGANHPEDVTVRDVHGDGLYGRGEDITVRRLHVDGTGRQGLGFTDGARLVVEDSDFARVARSVIDLEPTSTETVDGVTVRRCTFGSHGLSFSGGSGGAVIGSGGSGAVSNVLVEGCTSSGPFLVAVDGGRRSNFAVTGCTGGGVSNRQTFTFAGVDRVTVADCFQTYGGKGTIPAVKAVDCTDVVLSGNSFPGCTVELATT